MKELVRPTGKPKKLPQPGRGPRLHISPEIAP